MEHIRSQYSLLLHGYHARNNHIIIKGPEETGLKTRYSKRCDLQEEASLRALA